MLAVEEATAQIVPATRVARVPAEPAVLRAAVAGVALAAPAAMAERVVKAELSLLLIRPGTIPITSLPLPLEAQAELAVVAAQEVSARVRARLAREATEQGD